MRHAKALFFNLIAQRNVAAGLYGYLSRNKIPVDSSDLLRWQWVLAVAALDKYIHDIVRIGMVDEFSERRVRTSKYNTFQLSMNTFSAISSSSSPAIEFENEVVHKNSYLAFRDPDKIADALAYIWDVPNKWDIISSNMKTLISAKDLRTKLKNIIVRRNQIVHEGDCQFTTMSLSQQPICLSDTEDVIRFITELVEAIDKSIA